MTARIPHASGLAKAVLLSILAVPVAVPAAAAQITRADWGVTPDGQKVSLYTLNGAGGLTARITNFGGVIVGLLVPDRNGHQADVLLGEDDLASYLPGSPAAALIGRYANRIGNGGAFPLEGRTVQLERTTPGQKIVIHGGTAPFARKVWQAALHDGPEPSLTLTLVSPDGDGGFPGTLTAQVTYTLTAKHALRIEYRATTDKPTVVNLTNHAYFSLGGEGSGDVLNQRLQVFADRYTVFDADGLPTGEIASVAGTPLDFRQPVRVGDVVDSPFAQIAQRKGLDVNLLVNGRPGTLRPVARLTDPGSGRVMQVESTQPGVQLYSDNISGTVPGKGGKQYGARFALSFETQHYPDSPNHPDFPSTEITPATPLHEVTEFRFSTE
jgi:aldose 1-epimerase